MLSCRRLHSTGVDSSVANVPLGEPGRIPLYVGLPSAWGSVDGDIYFPVCMSEGSFWGLRQTYMNERIESPRLASGSGDGISLFVGTLLGNMEGAALLETLRERQ